MAAGCDLNKPATSLYSMVLVYIHFIHSLDRIDSRGPSRRLPVTTIDSPVPFRSDAEWRRAVCNMVEPRLTWTTAWSTPAWVWAVVPSHTDGLPQGSMCRVVTLQPYNMAKQLQPPPVDYLVYIRESRGIQNFAIADEMEPLEFQYLTMRLERVWKVLPLQCLTLWAIQEDGQDADSVQAEFSLDWEPLMSPDFLHRVHGRRSDANLSEKSSVSANGRLL